MKTRRWLLSLIVLTGMVVTLSAQTPKPAFELASVKPSNFPNESYAAGYAAAAGPCSTMQPTVTGTRVFLRAITLCGLIRTAYDLKEYQVVGIPSWTQKGGTPLFFEIDARVPTGVTRDQVGLMLQSLLVQRFGLVSRREPRKAPVYALVVGRQGHKMSTTAISCRADDPSCRCAPGGRLSGPGAFVGGGGTFGACTPLITMMSLAMTLGRELDRAVVDKTGLTGGYAFMLSWAGAAPLIGNDVAPSLFTAVQEQLGLRLEASTEPVDALIIDRVEPPTPN